MTVDAPPRVLPTRDDPFVAGVSRLAGGRFGRHAAPSPSWWRVPVRLLLALTVLTCLLGFLEKSPCRTHVWSNEFQYTRACYSDVYALYYAEGLGARTDASGQVTGRLSVPYRDHPVEYPAVIGGLMWVAAEVTNVVHPAHAGGADTRGATFFDITALMLAVGALLTTWSVARLAGRERVWDAAMVALAPTLLLHAFTNWDLAAVAFASLGMWAWSRRAPALAGVFLGLGVATKLYPVLILVALLFCCVRAARVREWVVTAATAAGAFAVAYLPALIVGAGRTFPFPDAACANAHPMHGWAFFWSLNTVRGADWDSLWYLLQQGRGTPLGGYPACGSAPTLLNLLVAVATIAVVGLVSLLVLAAPRRPRVPQVAFLLVAGFLLVNKVDSPQYVLWLLPLAVLARPRWPAFLAWQATEVALLVARFYYFVGVDKSGQGVPYAVFGTAVVLRDAALVGLMALVIREIRRPELDQVRLGDVDDPAGGVLDGAPDRWAAGRAVPAAGGRARPGVA